MFRARVMLVLAQARSDFRLLLNENPAIDLKTLMERDRASKRSWPLNKKSEIAGERRHVKIGISFRTHHSVDAAMRCHE